MVKRILVIAGTRPEIIKLAPVILHARETASGPVVQLCFTGQHATMAEEAMALFGIRPDFNLEIMRPDQTLDHIASAVFERFPGVLRAARPDVVLVQGDTTTAAMAAVCAFHNRIPVGHVEAGLRSFDLAAPFPEECNRRIISALATYNFCPTEESKHHLERESVPARTLHCTGNTIVDAVERIRPGLGGAESVDHRIRLPYILMTAHRRESFGAGFENICSAVRACAQKYPDVQWVYPVHLNPNVQKPVTAMLSDLPNVLLLPPVSYTSLLTLQKECRFVLTDSGGIQEEAPSFRKYCIVLRDKTERMESVHAGLSELVGTDKSKIVKAVERVMSNNGVTFPADNPYGDGKAAGRIMNILCR